MSDTQQKYRITVVVEASNLGPLVTAATALPISTAEADDLYRKPNARFRAWTGRNLRNYEPAPSQADEGGRG